MDIKVLVMKKPDGSDFGFMPERKSSSAAGFDLRAAEDATVYVGKKARIGIGISVEIEEGYEGQVRSRSGLAAKTSVFVINSPGTIDSDYRGEIIVLLQNLGEVPLHITRGDRIAQLVICALPTVKMTRVDALSSTERGENGLGSTGVK